MKKTVVLIGIYCYNINVDIKMNKGANFIMKKIRIGVLGAYRGSSMITYCKNSKNAELVAICDKRQEALDKHKADSKGFDITYYTDFDEFLNHDMDAVVLANYATEHAPFAVRALKKGLHVFSEVLPCHNMKQAIELIEAVEESGKVYAYGENYCYMPAPREMQKLYKEGKIGEFEYGECEYVHNCESIWPDITYGEKDHWRNNMFSSFYCTHSIGPIIHATGLRPVSVVGFEGTKNERCLRNGYKGGQFAIEMITLENGALIKSLHGVFLYVNSVWYSMYGAKGRMESAREDAENDAYHRIYVNADKYSGEYGAHEIESYIPKSDIEVDLEIFGHDGYDSSSMYNFIEKIKGNEDADTIDVYEAMDMYLPGLFAYKSILEGGKPMEIPNLRDKAVRELWRNDTACTDPKYAGDMLLPTSVLGTPEIADEVYEKVAKAWEEKCKKAKEEEKAKEENK